MGQGRLKQNLYPAGYTDLGLVFIAFVATTLGQLAPDLLRYLLLCAGQAAQKASAASEDTSIPEQPL